MFGAMKVAPESHLADDIFSPPDVEYNARVSGLWIAKRVREVSRTMIGGFNGLVSLLSLLST